MNEKQARLIRIWDIGRVVFRIAVCIFLLIDTFFLSYDVPSTLIAMALFIVLATLESVGEHWMRRNIPEAENRPYPKWIHALSILVLILVFYGIMKR